MLLGFDFVVFVLISSALQKLVQDTSEFNYVIHVYWESTTFSYILGYFAAIIQSVRAYIMDKKTVLTWSVG